MMELTPQQRRALRAKAHHLHPVVSIGQHGLTPRVLNEIDIALTAHGLVKIRVHSDDRAARQAMLAAIGAQLHAAPVQHLGKLLIVWRERDEDDAAAVPVAKSGPRTPSRPRHAGPASPPAERRDLRPAAATRRRRSSAVSVTASVPASPGSASRRASGPPRGAGYLTRGDAQAGRPPRKATTSTRPPRKLFGTAVTTKAGDEDAVSRERKPAARRSATKATAGSQKGKAATRRRGD